MAWTQADEGSSGGAHNPSDTLAVRRGTGSRIKREVVVPDVAITRGTVAGQSDRKRTFSRGFWAFAAGDGVRWGESTARDLKRCPAINVRRDAFSDGRPGRAGGPTVRISVDCVRQGRVTTQRPRAGARPSVARPWRPLPATTGTVSRRARAASRLPMSREPSSASLTVRAAPSILPTAARVQPTSDMGLTI